MDGGSRLRPIKEDALEAVGLPSKGDARLKDHKAQERYFSLVQTRYAKAAQEEVSEESIEAHLSALSISHTARTQVEHDEWRHAVPRLSSRTNFQEKAQIFMAMRKLREAIVASKRADLFAKSVYLFIIRAAILEENFESYHPAILHLLQFIHPRSHLSPEEYHEVVEYHVLDSACRLDNLSEAFELKTRFGLKNKLVHWILKALVRNNWILFNRAMCKLRATHQSLARMAQTRLRQITVRSLRTCYFTVDLTFIERSLNMRWEAILHILGVDWTLENEDKVVMRQLKAKSRA